MYDNAHVIILAEKKLNHVFFFPTKLFMQGEFQVHSDFPFLALLDYEIGMQTTSPVSEIKEKTGEIGMALISFWASSFES